MSDEKEIRWVGSAYDDLLAFPDDWKPFDDVGAGTKESAFGKQAHLLAARRHPRAGHQPAREFSLSVIYPRAGSARFAPQARPG